jgi:uncharacterized protein YybS (DUF2232 family)
LAYVRYGGRTAVLTAIVTTLFCALFVGPVEALLVLLPAGVLPGLVFGYGFRHKLKPLLIGALAIVVFFASVAAEYVAARTALLPGADPIKLLETQASEFSGPLLERYQQAIEAQPDSPQKEQALQQIKEMREKLPQTMQSLIPAVLFASGVMSAWINFQLSRLILPRFGHEVPSLTPFREWHLPAWLTWAFVLLSLAMNYGGRVMAAPAWWSQVLLNLMAPLLWIFIGVGMAVAYGYLRKVGIAKPLAILLAILGFFIGMGGQLYIILAMWDSIFDFRGLGHGLIKRPQANP